MKRIFNALGKKTKDANYQQKAVRHVEEMEKGMHKQTAPRHKSEEQHVKSAQQNEEIKKDLSSKHETLVSNMHKMNITRTDPVERWTSTKDLPTRESEWLHRNDPMWEYGFYEPDPSKVPQNKLMFREALEYLRARQEMADDIPTPQAAQRRQHAADLLEDLPATKRVDLDKLDVMFEYFRPFERKDKQKVVSKADLAQLQDHLQGYGDERRLMDGARDNVRALLQRNKAAVDEYDRLEASEKEKFKEAVQELRAEEHKRLEQRMQQINQFEDGMKKAFEAEVDKKRAEMNEKQKEQKEK